MTEELEMVEKVRQEGRYNDARGIKEPPNTFSLLDYEAAALIRAYGDRRMEAATKPLREELTQPILVNTNRLVDSLADARARIAELEAQLAKVKDDCAEKAVEWAKLNIFFEPTERWLQKRYSRMADSLRAAIKGE